MCYSGYRDDFVWVKSLKITKAGLISRHLISQIKFLNSTALFYANSENCMSLTCNMQNCRRNIARKQKNI